MIVLDRIHDGEFVALVEEKNAVEGGINIIGRESFLRVPRHAGKPFYHITAASAT